MPSCPNCAAFNSPPPSTVPAATTAPASAPPANVAEKRKKSVGKAVGAIMLTVTLALAAIVVLPGLGNFSQFFLGSKDTPINIFQLPTTAPKDVPREQLVQYALQLINSDRAKFSLPPVQLSNNEAAQVHAEDVYTTKQISHWMTNGEKPYMTYTRYGGTGNVHQNVAIAGFTADQYQKCNAILSTCQVIDPLSALKQLEYEMVYDDVSCCDNGHRENILDPHHTQVSIGIAYDKYYLAFVENFEDNYGLQTSVSDGTVYLTGHLSSGNLKQIEVHYDPLPTPAAYEQNKQLLSYSAGKLIAAVAPPLPFGYSYRQPADYRVIAANEWDVSADNSVNVAFRLGPIINLQGSTPATQAGVYTTYAVVEDNQGRLFEVTSYSIFVGGTSSSSTTSTTTNSPATNTS